MRLLLKIIASSILLNGCGEALTDKGKTRIVAKAGSEELDFEKYKRNLVQSPYVKDSSFNARRSIESWATESLFYQEAMDKLRGDEMQIEEQVQDYRKALVNYIYQTRLVDANLDTVVTNEEIQKYYQAHRASFILRENIVKVNYVKVPLKAAGLEKIRKLLQANTSPEQEQLSALLMQNAENFYMNDSTWLYVDDVKKEIPQLVDEPEYSISPGRIMEFTDKDYFYYLKVKDVKTKNALSPLNFERTNIRRFILNARKTQLIEEYKKLMLEKARKKKSFVIY